MQNRREPRIPASGRARLSGAAPPGPAFPAAKPGSGCHLQAMEGDGAFPSPPTLPRAPAGAAAGGGFCLPVPQPRGLCDTTPYSLRTKASCPGV